MIRVIFFFTFGLKCKDKRQFRVQSKYLNQFQESILAEIPEAQALQEILA